MSKPSPVAYVLDITDTFTGEKRLSLQTMPWHDSTHFWWTDGNMGCDCNRGMEFDRAIGGPGVKDDPDEDALRADPSLEPYPCTWANVPKGRGQRYHIKEAVFPDGSVIQIDGDPQLPGPEPAPSAAVQASNVVPAANQV